MQQKEDIEYRTRNVEGRSYMTEEKYFIIRYSLFDIRYSIMAHGKFIVPELPAAEKSAKHLQQF